MGSVSEQLQSLKGVVSLTAVIEQTSQQKFTKQGFIKCPFHNDGSPSLSVLDDRQYKCFGCDAGGDVYDWLQLYNKMSLNDARAYVESFTGRPQQKAKVVARLQIILPAPENNRPSFKHKNYQDPPIMTHAYRDEQGQLLGYTARFKTDKGKVVLPLTWQENLDTKECSWGWKSWDAPRPVYGLHKLHNDLDFILFVEGEKCADRGQEWADRHIGAGRVAVLAWCGGVEGSKYTNFEPVNNYAVPTYFWPDPPEKGGDKPIEILQKSIHNIKILELPVDIEGEFDIAYALEQGWTDEQVKDFIFPTPPDVIAPWEPPAQVDISSNTAPFKCLGYDDSKYYFFSHIELQIISRTPATLKEEMHLLQLAPRDWWQDTVLDGNEFKAGVFSFCAEWAINQCRKKGIYNPEKIRGRGAWIDDSRIVIHTGDELIVDGERKTIATFNSQYIYPRSQHIFFSTENPLSNQDAHQLLEVCQSLFWERTQYALYLAGWCAIAPFCGALDWRPHIWITSKAGSGKSWVQENVIRPMIAGFGCVVQGRTTEAGIRQELGSDSLPVLFDEAESENERGTAVIENILTLMRQASSEGGGKIFKGSASGKSQSFMVRSSFALSSIHVPIQHLSDQTRIAILSLIQDNTPEAQEHFKQLKERVHVLINKDYAHRMQARVAANLHVLKHNAGIFADAIAQKISSKRLGDQYGILIAGAYILTSTKKITPEAAAEWVDKHDWSDQEEIKEESDEHKIFRNVMNHILTVETKNRPMRRSVSELVDISRQYTPVDDIEPKTAVETLERNGLRVERDCVIIADCHDGVAKMMPRDGTIKNWGIKLKDLNGAERIQYRFGKNKYPQRAVRVPYL